RFASPRCPISRLSAFSRIEHVLKRIRSAWSRSGASLYPSDSSMPFMRSESCSFIWHPKVVTWYFLDIGGMLDRAVLDDRRFAPSLGSRSADNLLTTSRSSPLG